MIYSGLTVTREREKDVNFTRAYYRVNQSVAIRQGSGFMMSDLYAGRLRIGAQAGASGAAWVQDNLQRTGTMRAEVLVLFPDIQTHTEGLVNETIDASVFDDPSQEIVIAGRSLTLIGEIPTKEHYAVAVRKTDSQLLAMMDDGLGELVEDRTGSSCYRSTVLTGIPGLLKGEPEGKNRNFKTLRYFNHPAVDGTVRSKPLEVSRILGWVR